MTAQAVADKTDKAAVVGRVVTDGVVTVLTSQQFHPIGEPIPREALAEVAVAPYLALSVGVDLTGPITAAQAMAAIDAVQGAALLGTRADGSPVFVVGGETAPADLDLTLEGVLVELDGAITTSATGAAVLGHPSQALLRAIDANGSLAETVEAGQLVLVGPFATGVAPSATGSVALHFTTLGSIFLNGGTPPS